MRISEAQAYWRGKVCFCEGPKRPAESLCPNCLPKVSEQTRYTLQHASNPDDYRQALAAAELEILQWKPEDTQ